MQKEWLNAPALILIDIQKGFDFLEVYGGERNNPCAEHNAQLLLAHWRRQHWPLSPCSALFRYTGLSPGGMASRQ